MIEAPRLRLDRPMLTLMAACVVTLLALIPISHLSMSSSITESLGDGEAVRALATLERHFPNSNNILVLLETRERPVLHPDEARVDLLAAARQLAQSLPLQPELVQLAATIEHSLDAEIASFVETTMKPASLWYLDEAHAQAFAQRLTPQGMAAWISHIEVLLASTSPSGFVVKQMLNDPLGLHAIATSSLSDILPGAAHNALPGSLSRDGTSILLQITTQSTSSDTTQSQRIVNAVEAALDRLIPDTLQYTLTGTHVIAAYDAQHMRTDIIRSLVLSVCAVIAIFFVVYRRVSSVLLIITPLVCSITWTFATLSLLGMTVTPPIAVGAAVLAGLNADYAIHYLSAWTHAQSPRDAIAHIRRPLIGASTTSIVACIILLFSDFRLIREFALLGAVGLTCSLIATATVAPALSSFLTPSKPRTIRLPNPSRRPMFALLLVAVISLGAGWQFARGAPIRLFQSSSAVLHPMPNPPLAVLDRISTSFDGPAWTLPVVVRGSSPDDAIEKSRRLQASVEHDPALDGASVLGIHSLLPEPNRIMRSSTLRASTHALDTAAEFRAIVSNSMLNPDMFQSLESYIDDVLSPPPPPSLSDIPQPLQARLLATDGSHYFALVVIRFSAGMEVDHARATIIAHVQRLCASIEGCTPTGLDVVRLDVERTLHRELPILATATALAVGLWLMVFFSSIRAVLLALIPLFFGMSCLFLAMTALGIRLDMISLAAIPLLIGIGVDDGIFMVGAVRTGSRSQRETTHMASRRAIITTSVTTAGSFGSLVTTTTPAIQTLGLVVALGVLLCLAGSELVLVPMLHRSVRKDGL